MTIILLSASSPVSAGAISQDIVAKVDKTIVYLDYKANQGELAVGVKNTTDKCLGPKLN